VESTTPGPAQAAAKLEDLRGRIVSVDVIGARPDTRRNALELLASKPGTEFDAARVGDDVRALWPLGFADVRPEARLVSGGVALRFTVRELPRLASIDFRRGQAPAPELLDGIALEPGDPAAPVLLAEARRILAAGFRARGYPDVQIATTVTDAAAGGVDLLFTIEQGPAVVVSRVTFRGNRKVAPGALRDLLAARGSVAAGRPFWGDALHMGLLHIAAHYHDLGYANVHVGEPALTRSPAPAAGSSQQASVAIVIPIEEGARYRLGAVKFEGALLATEAEYTRLLGTRTGDVFARTRIADGMKRIEELHRGRGKPVTPTPVTAIDDARKRIALTIELRAAD
jgi:outer membrane protein insertion porin family